MAKCGGHSNNKSVGSLIWDGEQNNRGREKGVVHFSLWSAFSRSAFRRKLYDTIGCGISQQQQQQHCDDDDHEEEKKKMDPHPHPPFKKLCDILETSESSELGEKDDDVETKRKVGVLAELQRVVKKLDDWEEQTEGAIQIRRLAKDDSYARHTLAMLGAIPPLVSMLDSFRPFHSHIASLYALLNLSIGNDMNKEAIVKAGAVHKMLKLIQQDNKGADADADADAKQEAIVANFLALSALDSNKPIIGASGAIPFLVQKLQQLLQQSPSPSPPPPPSKLLDCLRAIYNLSIFPLNVLLIVETDLIQILLKALGDMEVSEWILSILTNIVSTPHGRKSLTNSPNAISILIDPLNWTDSPPCQEKASYILMVMAHKSYADRQSMVEAGIISSLLELTLIGTSLAQKRASRVLECLRMDKGKQVGGVGLLGIANNGASVSAPICGGDAGGGESNHHHQQQEELEEQMMSEESKAVKQLVQQSLQKNMRLIIKRANLPQHFVPSQHIRSLTMSSKSLPF